MKRANGEGSVEVLSDGRARVRAVLDGRRQQVGPLWPDRETAERMLAAWNEERRAGNVVTSSALTLATFGSGWLDRRELEGSKVREKVRSIRVERSIWGRHVAPSELAGMSVESVTAADVEAFARWLRKRTCVAALRTKDGIVLRHTTRQLSRSMQKHALRLVKQALRAAGNASANDVIVATGGPRPRDLSEDWLRQLEIETLLGCERIKKVRRVAYAVALGLSLRLDDVKAIEVSHMELDAVVPGPGVRVWVSKSERWHRVPVMPWLVPVLREHLATLPKNARYLFPAPGGGRYGKSYDFGWAVKKQKGRPEVPSALTVAGVARKIRFHDLRGTTATHLALGTWGRRWALHEIQAMLVHSDAKVTERYVRRAIDTLAEAAANTPGCPGLPMAFGEIANAPAQIRTADLSLRKAKRLAEVAAAYERPGQRMGNVADEVVRLALEGDVPHALLDELAMGVLGEEAPRLALELLRARGPLRLPIALRLCGLLAGEAKLRKAPTGREGR